MDYSYVHLYSYVRNVALSWNQLQKGLRLSFMWLCKGPSGRCHVTAYSIARATDDPLGLQKATQQRGCPKAGKDAGICLSTPTRCG